MNSHKLKPCIQKQYKDGTKATQKVQNGQGALLGEPVTPILGIILLILIDLRSQMTMTGH
jgi:hypothetical protein